MWGNFSRDNRNRSIPARAGKPPRGVGCAVQCGLSPPVRGNQAVDWASAEARGAIPARAGKPQRRLRGRAVQAGAIPARAGKPRRPRTRTRRGRGYPRPCGETRVHPGGHIGTAAGYPRPCGETSVGVPCWRPRWTGYPRPCGETSNASPDLTASSGLSPPVRGNHRLPPGADTDSAILDWGYPRPCGETCTHVEECCPQHRAIPARAGKPARGPTLTRREHAGTGYPRPCGETCRDVSKGGWRHERGYPRPCGETSCGEG